MMPDEIEVLNPSLESNDVVFTNLTLYLTIQGVKCFFYAKILQENTQ